MEAGLRLIAAQGGNSLCRSLRPPPPAAKTACARFPFRRRRYIGAGVLRPLPGGERHVRPAGRPAPSWRGPAFVAAPLGGMALGQLGADVIRFDALEGGLDYRRWPVTDKGDSIYWAGLNKGKRSFRVDIRSPPRARAGAGAHYRAGAGRRHLPHQPAGAGLDRLRGAFGHARGPHPAECARNPQRRAAGGLHRQRLGRLPLCHRAGRLGRAGRYCASRLGHCNGHDRRGGPARGRSAGGRARAGAG